MEIENSKNMIVKISDLKFGPNITLPKIVIAVQTVRGQIMRPMLLGAIRVHYFFLGNTTKSVNLGKLEF